MMQYLKDARKIERNENYAHLVGELRQRVHEQVKGLLEAELEESFSRQEIKDLICDELRQGQITRELEWYSEGFARGLFDDGSAYKRDDLDIAIQPKANRHNHLGYSAGMVLRQLRYEEGKVPPVG